MISKKEMSCSLVTERRREAFLPFWNRLRKTKCKIMAVSTDLGKAYISAILENLSGVSLVFDKLDVVKFMNDALTETRRGLYRELKDVMQKEVLKCFYVDFIEKSREFVCRI